MRSLSRTTQILVVSFSLFVVAGAFALVIFSDRTDDDLGRTAENATTTVTEEVAGPTVSVERERPTPNVYISITGSDSNLGESADDAVASVSRAVDLREPGGVVFFVAGDYPIVAINGVNGSSDDPITFRPASGSEGRVTMSSGTFSSRIGIQIRSSSYIVLDGFHVTKSQKGIDVESSSHIWVINNTVESVGQEAIRAHTESAHIVIRNNTISDTGRRDGYERGEGVYIGTGKHPQTDQTHDVLIEGNTIFNTYSEGVDVKAPTYNVTVRANRIFDIRTHTSGAIVLHLGDTVPENNPNLLVEDNWIHDITTGSPHQDGNGIVVAATATIRNNVIANTEHRGIFVEDDFGGGVPKTVDIHNNTLWNAGTDIEVRSGSRAEVSATDNISSDPVGSWTGAGNEAPQSGDFLDALSLDLRLSADHSLSRLDVGAFLLVGTAPGVPVADVQPSPAAEPLADNAPAAENERATDTTTPSTTTPTPSTTTLGPSTPTNEPGLTTTTTIPEAASSASSSTTPSNASPNESETDQVAGTPSETSIPAVEPLPARVPGTADDVDVVGTEPVLDAPPSTEANREIDDEDIDSSEANLDQAAQPVDETVIDSVDSPELFNAQALETEPGGVGLIVDSPAGTSGMRWTIAFGLLAAAALATIIRARTLRSSRAGD